MRRLSLGVLFALVLAMGGLGIANAAGVQTPLTASHHWQRGASQEAHAAATHADPVGTRGLRIWGDDRFETAVAISQQVWTHDITSTVFLATGTNYPDALAGGASTFLEGPILLVMKDSLPQVTADEIARLQPCLVVGFGGPGAISDTVLQQAQALTTGADCTPPPA